jgi:hypothetical protein
MSHPDHETVRITLPGNPTKEQMRAFSEAQAAAFDETWEYIKQEAEKLKVNEEDMSLIYYLRTRSRWTQEKEDHLIELSRNGQPLPNVLAGEF